MKPIELYLLSGFLGAGKTTLLQQLVKEFPRQKLGVLVNEFGGLGFDGTAFRTGGIRLVEINGGSIFCACLKDGFVRTLKAFSAQPIDALLIENSGMADPSAMPRLLEGLTPYLKRPYRYRGNICLVDGLTFFDYADVLEPVRNQIIAADALVVNKIDLLDHRTLEELHEALRQLNPDAPMLDTVFAQVPADFLRQVLPGGRPDAPGSNTPHSRPAVFSLQAEGSCPATLLTRLHDRLGSRLIRMKGFAFTEEGWLDVQAVNGRLTLTAADGEALEALPDDGIRLVFIARPDAGLTCGLIDRCWRDVFPNPFRLREN